MTFKFLRQKWCRIIYNFRQNTISGPETCEIGPKLWLRSCPDLPRPVQEDKYLLQTSGNVLIFSSNILVFVQNNVIFELLQQKWCRIIYKFRQNIILGPETCEIRPTVGNRTCPDLPRPVLLSRFIIFYKIISFTKRIYHFL